MTKVLLVEDDKSLREIYGVRLLAEGYDIVSAGDGEAALAMAIKERPQLIVSDVMMPKISGFDMLDILRSTTETKDIKVIMMTALSSEDQRARGEALGADRYLVKSQVGIEDVVRTVHEVLGDAPTTASSARATFGGPAPAPSMPRPSSMPTPQRPPSPATPQTQAPQLQGAQPTPVAPIAPTTPSFQPPTLPRPAETAPSAGLPQPTAPFSTTRPASLGDRIIHPITTPAGQTPKPDLSSLMDQELNQVSPQPIAPPPAPVAPIAPVQQQPPQPVQMPSAPPLPPQPAPAQPPAPQREESGISFEETPRQSAPASPQPAQFTPGPQPPTPSSV